MNETSRGWGFFLINANIALLVDAILQQDVLMLPRATMRFTMGVCASLIPPLPCMCMVIQAWRSCSLGLSQAYSLPLRLRLRRSFVRKQLTITVYVPNSVNASAWQHNSVSHSKLDPEMGWACSACTDVLLYEISACS